MDGTLIEECPKCGANHKCVISIGVKYHTLIVREEVVALTLRGYPTFKVLCKGCYAKIYGDFVPRLPVS